MKKAHSKDSRMKSLFYTIVQTYFKINETHMLNAPTLCILVIISLNQISSVCFTVYSISTGVRPFNRFLIHYFQLIRLQFLGKDFLLLLKILLLLYDLACVTLCLAVVVFHHMKPKNMAFTQKICEGLLFYMFEIFFWVLIIPNAEVWVTGIVVSSGYSNSEINDAFQSSASPWLNNIGLLLFLIACQFYAATLPAKLYFNSINGNASRRQRTRLEIVTIEMRLLIIILRVLVDYNIIDEVYLVLGNCATWLLLGVDYYLHGKFPGVPGVVYGGLLVKIFVQICFQIVNLFGVFTLPGLKDPKFLLLFLTALPFLLRAYKNAREYYLNFWACRGLTDKKNIRYNAVDVFLRHVQQLATETSRSVANIFDLSYSISSIISLYKQHPIERDLLINFLKDRKVDLEDAHQELLANRSYIEDFIMLIYENLINRGFLKNRSADQPPVTFLSSYLSYSFYIADRKHKALRDSYKFLSKTPKGTVDWILMEQISLTIKEEEMNYLEEGQRAFHATVYSKFFQNEEDYTRLTQEMQDICKKYVEFYSFINESTIDLNELDSIGTALKNEIVHAENAFKALFHHRSENLEFMSDYVNFLSKLKMSQPSEYRPILAKFHETLNRRIALQKGHKNELKLENILEISRSIMTLSGERDNLGRIIKASQSVASLLNYHREDIEGQNIKLLIPDYIIPKHDEAMLSYIYGNKTVSVFDRQKKIIYGLTRERLIEPLQIFIKTELFNDRLCLIGLFNGLKLAYSSATILTDLEGKVLGYNDEFVKNTGLAESEHLLCFEQQALWLFAPKLLKRNYYPRVDFEGCPVSWKGGRKKRAAVETQTSFVEAALPIYRAESTLPEMMKIYFFKHPKIEEDHFRRLLKLLTYKFVQKYHLLNAIAQDFDEVWADQELTSLARHFTAGFRYEDCEIYKMKISASDFSYFEGGMKLKRIEIYQSNLLTDPAERQTALNNKVIKEMSQAIQEIMHNYTPKSRNLTIKGYQGGFFLASPTFAKENSEGTSKTSQEKESLAVLEMKQEPSLPQTKLPTSIQSLLLLQPAESKTELIKKPDDVSRDVKREGEQELGSELNLSKAHSGRKSSLADDSYLDIPSEDIELGLLGQIGTLRNEIGSETFRQGLQSPPRDGSLTERNFDFAQTTHRGILETGNETQRIKGTHFDQDLLSSSRGLITSPRIVLNYQSTVHPNQSVLKDSSKVTPNSTFNGELSFDHPLLRTNYISKLPKHLFDFAQSPKTSHDVTNRIVEDVENENDEVKDLKRNKVDFQHKTSLHVQVPRIYLEENAKKPAYISSSNLGSLNDIKSHNTIDKNSSQGREAVDGRENFLRKFLLRPTIVQRAYNRIQRMTFIRAQEQESSSVKRPALIVNPEDFVENQSMSSTTTSSLSTRIKDILIDKKPPKSVSRFQWFGVLGYLIVVVVATVVAVQMRSTATQLAEITQLITLPIHLIFSFFSALKENSVLSMINEGRILLDNSVQREALFEREYNYSKTTYLDFKSDLGQLMNDISKPAVAARVSFIENAWLNIPFDGSYEMSNTGILNILEYHIYEAVTHATNVTNEYLAYLVLRTNYNETDTLFTRALLNTAGDVDTALDQAHNLVNVLWATCISASLIVICLILYIYTKIVDLKEKILQLFCTISKESIQGEILNFSRPLEEIFGGEVANSGKNQHNHHLAAAAKIREGKRAISSYRRLERRYCRIGVPAAVFFAILVTFFVVTSVISNSYIQHLIENWTSLRVVAQFPKQFALGISGVVAALAHDQVNQTDFGILVNTTHSIIQTFDQELLAFSSILTELSDPRQQNEYDDKIKTELIDVFLNDYCPYITSESDDLLRCQRLLGGFSHNGLYSSARLSVNYYKDLFERFIMSDMNIAAVSSDLDDITFAENADFYEYLAKALLMTLLGLVDHLVGLANTLKSIMVGVLVFGYIFFAIVFLGFWFYFVRRMNWMIQNTKAMLSLIPLEVLSMNVYVKNFFTRGF